jgi:hypothetical protein
MPKNKTSPPPPQAAAQAALQPGKGEGGGE